MNIEEYIKQYAFETRLEIWDSPMEFGTGIIKPFIKGYKSIAVNVGILITLVGIALIIYGTGR